MGVATRKKLLLNSKLTVAVIIITTTVKFLVGIQELAVLQQQPQHSSHEEKCDYKKKNWRHYILRKIKHDTNQKKILMMLQIFLAMSTLLLTAKQFLGLFCKQ